MQRAARRPGRPQMVWLGGLLLSLLVGCNPPCTKLSQLICKSLGKQKKLCEIARQECQQKEATFRRCRALADTWESSGQKQLVTFAERYQKYRNWVARKYKMHRGLELMDVEHKRFRRLLRKLLQLPTLHTKDPSPPRRTKARKR